MKERKIDKQEQSCISGCILKYWGNPVGSDDAEQRDKDYEGCLAECQICG